jgi:3'-5' exonuclease
MKALQNINLDNVIFLDIETVNLVNNLEKGTPLYNSWHYKQKDNFTIDQPIELDASYKKVGALYPEFAKIVCISIGKIVNNALQVKSYFGDNEKDLLVEFTEVLGKMQARNKALVFAGHCIKGFDLPFIMRRCIVNGVETHSMFDFGTTKPWEINVIDIFELWKGSSFNSASLINMAVALGLPSPKDDIAGYEVAATYWNSKDNSGLQRIATYCEKDVLTTANIILKCMYKEPIKTAVNEVAIKEPETPLLTALFNGGKYGLKEAKQLTDAYYNSTEQEKKAMVTILKSIITKDTSFTAKHLEAIINYTPKVK